MRRAPSIEVREMGPGLGVQWYQLHVLHAPAAVELLDDELAVQQHLDLPRSQFAGQREGSNDRGVFGHVVRLDAQVFRDRGDRGGVGAARRRADGFDQYGAARRRTGIAPCGAVRTNDEPEAGARTSRLQIRVGRFGVRLGGAD